MNYIRVTGDDQSEVARLSALASEIVKEHYDPILGAEQNDYMIEKFQSVHAINEQLEHGYLYYLAEEEPGKAVAFLGFYPRENDLYLSKFYLHKTRRGNGLSRDMLSFVASQAKALDRTAIVLNVNKYNSALKAYDALGFVCIGAEVNDIGRGYVMDDYVLKYEITE